MLLPNALESLLPARRQGSLGSRRAWRSSLHDRGTSGQCRTQDLPPERWASHYDWSEVAAANGTSRLLGLRSAEPVWNRDRFEENAGPSSASLLLSRRRRRARRTLSCSPRGRARSGGRRGSSRCGQLSWLVNCLPKLRLRHQPILYIMPVAGAAGDEDVMRPPGDRVMIDDWRLVSCGPLATHFVNLFY